MLYYEPITSKQVANVHINCLNLPMETIMRVLNPPPGYKPWHGGPTLMGALRGVDARQAVWKTAPDRHSIWELSLHIAYWNYAVRRHFDPQSKQGFPRSPSNFPEIGDPSEEAWKADKKLISDEHTSLILAIQAFPEKRMDQKVPKKDTWTYRELVTGVTVHGAYHIGQIQLMKRLYASMDQ